MPFVARYTPEYSRLASIYDQGSDQLSRLALQRGATTADALARLASIFSGYQDSRRQREAVATAAAVRTQEREADRRFEAEQKRLEREERAAERKADAATRKEEQDRGAARWMVDNRQPGVMSAVEAALALRFPETAARFSKQRTLPATVTPGAIGAVSQTPTETGQVELHANPDDARAAEQIAAQRDRWAAEDAARGIDDDRQERALQATIANQEAMRRIAQQNANTTAANAQARLGGGTGTLSASYRNALERVLSNIPANRRGPKVAHATRLFEEQNEAELKDFIRQNAIEGENVDTKNQVLGRMATIASLEDTQQILNELRDKGVHTNILKGSIEDIHRALGTTSDPELVALRNRLAGTLINYRRAATGVAFGEKEGSQYEKMFPNYKNTAKVNEALITGLMREMRTYDRVYWEHKLGKEGAAAILGENYGIPSSVPMTPPVAPGAAARPRILSITPVTRP